MKKKSLALIFIFSTLALLAKENTIIDSLKIVLESKKDTSKIDILNEIGSIYSDNGNFKQAIKYYNKALNIAQEQNHQVGIILINQSFGRLHSIQGNFTTAHEYYQKSLKECKAINDLNRASLIYREIAITYAKQGNYAEALNFFLKNLEIVEQLGNENNKAEAYGNVGNLYLLMYNYDKALEYYNKCLNIFKSTNNDGGLANIYNNIGLIYENKNKFELALQHYKLSLELEKKIENKHGIADSYNNIGNIYLSIIDSFTVLNRNENSDFLYKMNYDQLLDSGIYYQNYAYKIQIDLNDRLGMINSLKGIGKILKMQSKIRESISQYENAMKLSKEIGAEKELYLSYKYLAELWKKVADCKIKNDKSAICNSSKSIKLSAEKCYQKAYDFHVKYANSKDVVFNRESNAQIVEMETKYETHKKEQEIAMLNKEQEINQLEIARDKEKIKNEEFLIFALLIVCLFILTLVFLIYNRYRLKKNANVLLAEQNEEIHQQAEEIRTQHEALEEVNIQLKKKNIEVFDSINYAFKIQQALLTTDEYLKKNIPNHYILYKPKDIVSGDFYWAYKNKNSNELYWVVADCTGHGVAGAFMSILGVTLLNEIIIGKKSNEVDTIVTLLSDGLVKALKQHRSDSETKDGMEIGLCKLNLNDNTLDYCGAHHRLLLYRNGKVTTIDGANRSVGYNSPKNSITFSKTTLNLEKNDLVICSSDGYTDQFGNNNGKRKKYMIGRFIRTIEEIGDKDLQEQKRILNDKFEKWKGNYEQIDDVLVMGLRI